MTTELEDQLAKLVHIVISDNEVLRLKVAQLTDDLRLQYKRAEDWKARAREFAL